VIANGRFKGSRNFSRVGLLEFPSMDWKVNKAAAATATATATPTLAIPINKKPCFRF